MKRVINNIRLKLIEAVKILRDPRPDLITPVPDDAPVMVVYKMGHASVTGRVQSLDYGRVKVTDENGTTVIIGASALYSIEPTRAPAARVVDDAPLSWTDAERAPASGGCGNGSASKTARDRWISDEDIAAVIESSLIEMVRGAASPISTTSSRRSPRPCSTSTSSRRTPTATSETGITTTDVEASARAR